MNEYKIGNKQIMELAVEGLILSAEERKTLDHICNMEERQTVENIVKVIIKAKAKPPTDKRFIGFLVEQTATGPMVIIGTEGQDAGDKGIERDMVMCLETLLDVLLEQEYVPDYMIVGRAIRILREKVFGIDVQGADMS